MATRLVAMAIGWARCGRPEIILGHELTASLLNRDASAVDPERFSLPWPTFLLHIPCGIVTATSIAGELVPIDSVMAQQHRDGTLYLAGFSGACDTQWHHPAEALADLLDDIDDVAERANRLAGWPIADVAAFSLMGRLIVGAALECGPGGKVPYWWRVMWRRNVEFDCQEDTRSDCARGPRDLR
jgi:hypothetical protein